MCTLQGQRIKWMLVEGINAWGPDACLPNFCLCFVVSHKGLLQVMPLMTEFWNEVYVQDQRIGTRCALNVDSVLFQIGQCVKLGVLSLRDNRVLYLPPEIGNLKELHVLDVSGNRCVYSSILVALFGMIRVMHEVLCHLATHARSLVSTWWSLLFSIVFFGVLFFFVLSLF